MMEVNCLKHGRVDSRFPEKPNEKS